MTLVRLLALLAATFAISLLAAYPASAQVPPVSLRCTSTDTTVSVGSSITVNCTLLDAGTALPRDDVNPVTYTVNYEAGTSAGYEGGGKTRLVTTDKQGKASAVLNVGDKQGSLGILVTYYGTYSAFFAVRVEGAPPPETEPAPELPPLEHPGLLDLDEWGVLPY